MAEVPYGISVEASGKINNNLSWYIEPNGTLTFSGTGIFLHIHMIQHLGHHIEMQ